MASGLYIVELHNKEKISVNRQNKRIAEKTIKVNQENIKFGKTVNLDKRRKNYHKTFGEENVSFHVIFETDDIHKVERNVLRLLDDYRLRGRTGRKNEWLFGITKEELEAIIYKIIASNT